MTHSLEGHPVSQHCSSSSTVNSREWIEAGSFYGMAKCRTRRKYEVDEDKEPRNSESTNADQNDDITEQACEENAREMVCSKDFASFKSLSGGCMLVFAVIGFVSVTI